MTRSYLLPIFLATLFCTTSQCQEAAPPGAIHGTVLNEQGQPVAKVKVALARAYAKPIATLLPKVETDTDGRFSFPRLELGTYGLSTEKESDGYPNTRMDLYKSGPAVQVTLDANDPVKNVTLRIGPKCGKLNASIRNAVTGDPPQDAAIRIWDRNNERHWVATMLTSKHEVPVPANTDVGITVTAPGYRAWFYPGSQRDSQANRIVLKPNEKLNVDILLQPESDGPKPGTSPH